MDLLIILACIAAVIILLVVIIKPYFEKYDTIIAYTGGLGSGKSFSGVKMSLKLLRKQKLKVKIHNFLHKKDKWEEPILLSNIPILINKKSGFSTMLTNEHLTLQERIPNRSIVFIDEVGAYASQWDYNVSNNFEEFIRLFRHYTLGGYLIVTEQCTENIVNSVRRRLNQVYNLMHFKKWFGIIYSVKIRNLNVSEEIKTIEENNSEDNMKTRIGFLPLKKHYDTYCYSVRYNGVPSALLTKPKGYKRYSMFRISRDKKPAKTLNKEPEETTSKN